jgi:hypothetical protein
MEITLTIPNAQWQEFQHHASRLIIFFTSFKHIYFYYKFYGNLLPEKVWRDDSGQDPIYRVRFFRNHTRASSADSPTQNMTCALEF